MLRTIYIKDSCMGVNVSYLGSESLRKSPRFIVNKILGVIISIVSMSYCKYNV